MEKLRREVKRIAYEQDCSKLPAPHRTLIPLLSLASSLYKTALSLRRLLYHLRLLSTHRLPVPVISVGNLTWGGNGKTPMVKYIALSLRSFGVSPLVLTRGYGGGDEAKMLMRHLLHRNVKIGVGANRVNTAARFLEKYGHLDSHDYLCKEQLLGQKSSTQLNLERIGAVVLDDGLQHWSMHRDLEIVMINGLAPWGNQKLLPLGPLREPLRALERANVVIVHHANLVSEQNLESLERLVREAKESTPIFFSKMSPSCFFEVQDVHSQRPLHAVSNAILLCVSAIGSPNTFVQAVQKMGATYVDRLDYSDHHVFEAKDAEVIKVKLKELEEKFGSKPVVVITEKDYDRDPEAFMHLSPFKVMVLCSELQFISRGRCNEDSFKELLRGLLKVNTTWRNHCLSSYSNPIG